MKTDPNPYAPPDVASEVLRVDSDRTGLWRAGNLLVMSKNARLPNVCVKSGEPTDIPGTVRRLYWLPRWVILTLFLGGPLITAVFAYFWGRRAKVEFPLSEIEQKKRKRRMVMGNTLALGAPVVLILCCVGAVQCFRATEREAIFALAAFGFIPIVSGIAIAAAAERIVAVHRIDDDYVWLKGVHRDLLATLP